MTKALMVATLGTNITSGNEINVFGFNGTDPTEAQAQVSATEGCTFSKLGFNYITGASGTNTLQFRDAGANGQQVASRAGAGAAEDTTNSDVLSAADLFNLAHTDTATDPATGWIKMNVEMASGHGNFHGAAAYNGVVFDAQSDTRFIPLTGGLATDGATTESLVSLRNRAYDTLAAFQVYVEANDRLNDSVFKVRAGNADVAGSTITFATTQTGLKQVTGLSAAIAIPSDINAAITLDTGIQDLIVNFYVATLKSSTGKSDSHAFASAAGLTRAASATEHFFTIGGRINSITEFTEANARIVPGFAATVSYIRIYCSANTYTADATLTLYKGGVALLTQAITASGGAGYYENAIDDEDITANDELSWGIVGGTSGSATIHSLSLTFSPAAGGSELLPKLQAHALFTGDPFI